MVFVNAPAPEGSMLWRARQILLKEWPFMRRSAKDKAKAKFHEMKGKVKEKVGRATNDPKLKARGLGEQARGKVQKKIGQVEKVLGI
jgi:uncharacterized protein YjbJ (UPF0337 family)